MNMGKCRQNTIVCVQSGLVVMKREVQIAAENKRERLMKKQYGYNQRLNSRILDLLEKKGTTTK